MKTIVIIASFLTILHSSLGAIDIHRLSTVQTMIDSARSQADLNQASVMLFEVWDDELKKKEDEVARTLPKPLAKKFKASMKQWRKHAMDMSSIRSELFKQDFMEPKYYRMRGIESKLAGLKRAKNMQPYVYNMSRSIYYEEKWIELDILLNTK